MIIALDLGITALSWADLPEYDIKRSTEKIVIDGILDKLDWKPAQNVGEFIFPWECFIREKDKTEVKMIWDDTFLYIIYRCEDKHIWATHFDTNSKTYLDDCGEFFWNPAPEKTKYYNIFEFNPLGNMISPDVVQMSIQSKVQCQELLCRSNVWF